MIRLEINGRTFGHPEGWHELTLMRAKQLVDIKLPARFASLFAAIKNGDQKQVDAILDGVTDDEFYREIPKYYGECIGLLAGVDRKTMERVTAEDRRVFYNHYTSKFVSGLYVNPTDYEPKDVTGFKFKGVEYLLPEDLVVNGERVPMGRAEVIEFTEAADLQVASQGLGKGRLEYAANIISILCRPEGEKYDEMRCLERATEFTDLTMDVIWDVFFSLTKQSVISMQRSLICFLERHQTG